MEKKYLPKIVSAFILLLLLTVSLGVVSAQPYNPNYVAPKPFLLETPTAPSTITNTQGMLNATDPRTNALINNYVDTQTKASVASGAVTCTGSVNDFKSFIQCRIIGGILSPLVPLLISLAVVMFIYGVVMFTFAEGGEKKEDAKKFMFWGIIGLFVMISMWGLVAVFQNSFGLGGYNSSVIPKLNI